MCAGFGSPSGRVGGESRRGRSSRIERAAEIAATSAARCTRPLPVTAPAIATSASAPAIRTKQPPSASGSACPPRTRRAQAARSSTIPIGSSGGKPRCSASARQRSSSRAGRPSAAAAGRTPKSARRDGNPGERALEDRDPQAARHQVAHREAHQRPVPVEVGPQQDRVRAQPCPPAPSRSSRGGRWTTPVASRTRASAAGTRSRPSASAGRARWQIWPRAASAASGRWAASRSSSSPRRRGRDERRARRAPVAELDQQAGPAGVRAGAGERRGGGARALGRARPADQGDGPRVPHRDLAAAEPVTASRSREPAESEGGRTRTVTRPPPTLTSALVRGPAGQRRPRRPGRRAPRGERQRPRLSGAVGERQRVAGGEQLEGDEAGQQQRRQRRDELHRRLAPPAYPPAGPSFVSAPTSTLRHARQQARHRHLHRDAVPSPRPCEPARSGGGSAALAAAAAPPPTSAARAPARAAIARRPERLAGERQLRRHQDREEEEGQDPDQLDRGGPLLPPVRLLLRRWRHPPTVALRSARVARSSERFATRFGADQL